MTKKWKILGIQTNVEWYDVKTKFKQLIRKITYSWLFQELVCFIFASYMRLVYFTSKKVFVNHEIPLEAAKSKTPIIFCFWHNRLMMTPFATRAQKKIDPTFNLMTLASRHGDGKLVGKTMRQMGLIPVFGSSNDGRKASRGIDISSLKKIFKGLKNGVSLGITPDGPRGPNQTINGEVVNISRISQVGMLPMSYSSSKCKQLRTWDKFTIPLPFSTLCFYFDDALIQVDKNATKEDMELIKDTLKKRMDLMQEKSQESAEKNSL